LSSSRVVAVVVGQLRRNQKEAKLMAKETNQRFGFVLFLGVFHASHISKQINIPKGELHESQKKKREWT
jgi:hypothetical protein